MATIEVSPALILSALGALGSLLAATWAVSRRSRDWDEVEKHRKVLFGEPENKRHGLIEQVVEHDAALHGDETKKSPGLVERVVALESGARITQLEEAVTQAAFQMKVIMRALGAKGSGEHDMIVAIQSHLEQQAAKTAAHTAVQIARRRIVADQEARLHERDDTQFVETILAEIAEVPESLSDEGPSSPHPPQLPNKRLRTPPPFEAPRFNPEDTGRHPRRK